MAELKKTRKEAMQALEPFYMTGNPCKHGHIAKRATASSECCDCRKLINAAQKQGLKEFRKKLAALRSG